MHAGFIIAVALAGATSASTPPGFEPASTSDLAVAFANVSAMNGIVVARADTSSAPKLATIQRLDGSYTIMMVDPDIPPSTAGGATSELLHWLQAGFVSSSTPSTLFGQSVFLLENPTNTTPFASYIQPNPPNKSPVSHRYTQLLLNTTANDDALAVLLQAGKTRGNFSAVNVLQKAGLQPVMGNSFNVTNQEAIGNGSAAAANGTKTTTAAGGEVTVVTSTSMVGATSATGGGTGTNGTVSVGSSGEAARVEGKGAMIAGMGAVVAAVAIF